MSRQLSPIHRRSCVMLDVIPIVEQQEVIQPAVVTDRTSRVFVVALQMTKPEPDEKTRQVNGHHKAWSKDEQRSPQSDRCAKVERRELQVMPLAPPLDRKMMRQVPRSPERLWKAKQKREVAREAGVQRSRPEKRPVDELVRDRVRVPPQPNGNQRDRRPDQEHSTMRQRKRDRQSIPRGPPRLPEHTCGHC